MSPWANLDNIVRDVGSKYVLSVKPSPAIFVGNNWDPGRARNVLETVMQKAKGCHIEFIMKDISTLGYHPERLWEWEKIAMDVAERC